MIEPLGVIHQNRATKLHNINVILFQNLAGGEKEIMLTDGWNKGKCNITQLRF